MRVRHVPRIESAELSALRARIAQQEEGERRRMGPDLTRGAEIDASPKLPKLAGTNAGAVWTGAAVSQPERRSVRPSRMALPADPRSLHAEDDPCRYEMQHGRVGSSLRDQRRFEQRVMETWAWTLLLMLCALVAIAADWWAR